MSKLTTKSLFNVYMPVLLAVATLNPVAYNPRKISPEKFEALKESIRTEGFLEPVVIQKTGSNIIGGHQRVRAVREIAIEAGVHPPDLPCIVLDIDDRAAKKLNIKLNNLKGDFEPRMLGELLVDIVDHKPLEGAVREEVTMLGLMPDEASRFMGLIDPEYMTSDEGGSEGGKSFGRNPTLSIEFGSVSMRDKVKKLLAERTDIEKKKSGDIVAIHLGLTKKKTQSLKRSA